MENSFQHRETVGVEDFVLLENFTSEDAFVDNLRKRFQEDLIYVRNIIYGTFAPFLQFFLRPVFEKL